MPLAFQGGKKLTPEVVGIVDDTEVASEVNVPLDQLAEVGVLRQDTSISILLEPGADSSTVRDAVDDAAKSVPIVASTTRRSSPTRSAVRSTSCST